MQKKARLGARAGFCLALSLLVCGQPSAFPDYILGAGDLILVRALHVPEMPDKPIPIAADGTIDLPMAGRVKAAGDTVRVSRPLGRGAIPLEGAREMEGASVVELSLPDLLEAKHPGENLLLQPDDVVTVPRAKLVYVVGEVKRAGGFVLHDRASMPVLQALSLAEGLTPVAGAAHAKIVREGPDRQEIPVNIKDLLAGRAADPMLQAGDILFVPDSQARNAGLRAIEAAIQMGTGVVIWRR